MTAARRKGVLLTLEVATPVVLLALWWVLSSGSTSTFNPPLSEIAQRFVQNWFGELFVTYFLPSLGRTLAGYAIAVVIGVVGGTVIGLSYVARRLTGPLVSFLRSIPGAALLAPAVTLLGVGDAMKIAIIAFVCVWPILLNTIDGIDEMAPTQRNTDRIFQVNGMRRLMWSTLPGASPRIFAGLRTSLALALIMLVISEMIASTGGLGYFILQAQTTFDVADMWSGIILLGLLGYALTLAFTFIERRVLRWYFESKGTA
ncbi:ABC transporter permease [Microbacterium kribbense]|uniref:ABC transporter permease n=1 Tax=Microbacterium kribbense TaxID=433645 RepID=A0ABP7GQM2_9MICO